MPASGNRSCHSTCMLRALAVVGAATQQRYSLTQTLWKLSGSDMMEQQAPQGRQHKGISTKR